MTHPKVNRTDLFINLVILNRTNLITYTLNGNSRLNATNVTINAVVNKTYMYRVANGSSVYLIAFPSDNTNKKFTKLIFTFNLSSSIYPPQGMKEQLISELLLNDQTNSFVYVVKGYWVFIATGFALVTPIIIGILLVVMFKNFDPDTPFEKHRKQLIQ